MQYDSSYKDYVVIHILSLVVHSTLETINLNYFKIVRSETYRKLTSDERWSGILKDALKTAYQRDLIPQHVNIENYSVTAASVGVEKLLNQIENTVSKNKKTKQVSFKIVDDSDAFSSLVLEEGHIDKIKQAIIQLKEHQKIFDEWGLENICGKKGRGINMLFYGAPGTGKTFTAEMIARYMGTEIEFGTASNIESKWVGESQKNLSEMFQSLSSSNKKVLILDEADGILNKRSDGDSSQHHNSLVSQFLHELERHDGVCILTTNKAGNIDPAIMRRLDLILEFKSPNAEARKLLWQTYLNKIKIPSIDVLLTELDRLSQFEITGSTVKSVLLDIARKKAYKEDFVINFESVKDVINGILEKKLENSL